MSKIYDYLKEKACGEYKNHYVFFQNMNYRDDMRSHYYQDYTFEELYDAVNCTIDFLSQKNITKQCFLIVKKEISDIITFIALLELGINPIIINDAYLESLYNSESIENPNIKYSIIPSLNIDEENISLPNHILLNTNHWTDSFIDVNINTINELLVSNIDIDNNLEYDFGILTSGTTGKAKVFKIKENDLINKILKKYDCEKKETYVCTIPISAISAITFSLYLPIIANNKSCSIEKHDLFIDESTRDHLNIILPPNYIKDNDIKKNTMLILNYSHGNTDKIDSITILGDKASSNMIGLLHTLLKNKKKGIITNYYGRTENLGLISKINENDIKIAYLYFEDIKHNKIIYSFDKKNVYEDTFENGMIKTRISSILYDEKLFSEVLPIAIMNQENEDIKINSSIFGEIIADGDKTGDYGFTLDNKIYYLCRENELLKLEDNSYYYVTGLDNVLCNTRVIEDLHDYYSEYGLYQNIDYETSGVMNYIFDCYYISNNDLIDIYITCNCIEYLPDNFRRSIMVLENLFELPKKLNSKINTINLIDRKNLPYGMEVGKLKRNKLLEFKHLIDFNNFKWKTIDYITIIKKILSDKLGINSSISLIYDYIAFSKSSINESDIAKILNIFKVIDYREDENNYYLMIDDEFLFAKDVNEKNNFSMENVDKYIDLIKKNQIRDCLLKKYNLLKQITLGIGILKEENGLLSVIYETADIKNNYDVDDPDISYYARYRHDCIEKFTGTYLFNIREFNIDESYFNRKYSIDNDNNLYCDNELIQINCFTDDITRVMYQILLNYKSKNIPDSKTKKLEIHAK